MHNPSAQGKLVLILGGVRSGKSRFAQELATALAQQHVLFVATAQASDGEMARRIQHHRESRSTSWSTLEQPLSVGQSLMAIESLPPVILLDCLTLLVNNVLLQVDYDEPQAINRAETRLRAEIDGLLCVRQQRTTCLIIVSGEVGMGIVPENPLARHFRDLLGWANQAIAEQADASYLMVAGQAINTTTLASSVQQAARELHLSSNRELSS